VLKAGNTLIVAESEVFAHPHSQQKLVSKAMVTLAVVTRNASSRGKF
jgi:acyl-coenzyme A thioesterase PaaI-like protein